MPIAAAWQRSSRTRRLDFPTLLLIAAAGALASPAGGALSLWLRPSTLALSLAVGFAGGALLGACTFEVLPKAAEMLVMFSLSRMS